MHNKDNVNLHQMLGQAHDEDAAKCTGVASRVYNLGDKFT